MSDIITTLHPENDETVNLYPNIKKDNIPDGSIDRTKLDNTVNGILDNIGELHPSGVDTSTNILTFTEDKGIYIGTDTGHWYYWNGTQYADGGVYQAVQIADNSVTTSKIVDNAVTTSKIVDDAVTTAKILNYSITTDKLGFSSVTNSRIKDNDIDASVKLRDASITTNKLNTGCVNSSKLADDSVYTSKIVDGNVTTAKIANNAITNEKIGYHAVDVTKIDDNAIQTSKIADYQVTKVKIANYNVDETKVTFYCDDDYVKEDYNFSGKTAVFFGDSITIGTQEAPTPYPNYLCNKVGMTLSGNYAVGGAGYGVANNQILTQVQNASIKNSDYVFISAGINDYLSGVSIDYLIYKVNEVLDYVLNNYPGKIILITPIKDNLSFVMNIPLQLYRNSITECGISKDTTNRITVIQGIKFNFPNRNSSDTYKSLMFVDTLHPTDFAYKTVYVNGILKALK